MIYLTYIFNLVYNTMNKIVVPIPFSDDIIFHLSIFSIFCGILCFSILFYFIKELVGFEFNFYQNQAASDFKKAKNDKYVTIKREYNSSSGMNEYKVLDTSTKRVKRK